MLVEKIDETLYRIVRDTAHVFMDSTEKAGWHLFLGKIVLDARIASFGMVVRMSRALNDRTDAKMLRFHACFHWFCSFYVGY